MLEWVVGLAQALKGLGSEVEPPILAQAPACLGDSGRDGEPDARLLVPAGSGIFLSPCLFLQNARVERKCRAFT